MLDSIIDLTKARPHMHKTARFSSAELHAFHQGYYFGVIYSLRVAEEAMHRFALYRRERRAAAKVKRSA